MSVATVWGGIIGYGPSDTVRAGHDLIEEATVLIFSDDFDTGAATARVADRKRSAIRWNFSGSVGSVGK